MFYNEVQCSVSRAVYILSSHGRSELVSLYGSMMRMSPSVMAESRIQKWPSKGRLRATPCVAAIVVRIQHQHLATASVCSATSASSTQNFQILYPIQGVPCENLRPKDSENVVLFGSSSFYSGVIGCRSRVKNQEKNWWKGGVKKKDTATILIFEPWNE